MSDILDDAQAWLDALPLCIGTHFPGCHTRPNHAPCLVRRLMDEIARLRITDEEREAIERGYYALTGVEDMSVECVRRDAEAADTLRKLLARLA